MKLGTAQVDARSLSLSHRGLSRTTAMMITSRRCRGSSSNSRTGASPPKAWVQAASTARLCVPGALGRTWMPLIYQIAVQKPTGYPDTRGSLRHCLPCERSGRQCGLSHPMIIVPAPRFDIHESLVPFLEAEVKAQVGAELDPSPRHQRQRHHIQPAKSSPDRALSVNTTSSASRSIEESHIHIHSSSNHHSHSSPET